MEIDGTHYPMTQSGDQCQRNRVRDIGANDPCRRKSRIEQHQSCNAYRTSTNGREGYENSQHGAHRDGQTGNRSIVQIADPLRHIGLPGNALSADLETLYVNRLLDLVRGSSLQAIVILAQDQVYDEQGKLMDGFGSFHVPNDYVLALARKHPQFLPAVSIHPARPDALEELDRCLEAGAVMLKCLPNCQNINCNDRRLTRFWERMAEAKLPLLAHTGGEHTVPVVCRAYADPRILTLPLETAKAP